MIKMILSKTLMLSLSLCAFNVTAHTITSQDGLANQCYDLAEKIDQLVLSQRKVDCADKLMAATYYVLAAADSILDELTTDAKAQLQEAIYDLIYAELKSCNRYIQIAHSKSEAKRIKNAL